MRAKRIKATNLRFPQRFVMSSGAMKLRRGKKAALMVSWKERSVLTTPLKKNPEKISFFKEGSPDYGIEVWGYQDNWEGVYVSVNQNWYFLRLDQARYLNDALELAADIVGHGYDMNLLPGKEKQLSKPLSIYIYGHPSRQRKLDRLNQRMRELREGR